MIKSKTKRKDALAIGKGSPSAYATEPSIVLHKKDSVDRDRVHSSSCSPLEFHNFIPWLCKEWSASTTVIITRKAQETLEKGRSTNKHTRSMPNIASRDDLESSVLNHQHKTSSNKFAEETAVTVPVTAYYNANQQLVEISIVGSTVVPSRIIHAFSLSVPYHSKLTRLTFRRSGLTAKLVYEIKKSLLPTSNICEIIFDDSYVREGNYYILLEQNSQLKYLSLNRCKINDEVCKKIFEKLEFDYPAGKTLQLLQLGSNEITDDAAIFIGSVLRSNRCLVHLNLSGNRITDSGFIPILDSLMEFPMNSEEIRVTRQRKMRYLQSKEVVYKRCLSDLKCGNSEDLDSGISRRQLNLNRLHSLEEHAEIMSTGILGEFDDPFSQEIKDGSAYSKGNLVLCYINIAYNNLEYPSVQKLWEVLRYQDGTRVASKSDKDKDTGLIRVTLDGNKIPQTCLELEGINFYLTKVIKLKAESRTEFLNTKAKSQRKLRRSSNMFK